MAKIIILIKFSLIVILFLSPLNTHAQVVAQDSMALVDLYNSTNGQNWTYNYNWLSGQPLSTWYGVTTGGGSYNAARVVKLDLPYNNLTGPFAIFNL